VDVVVLVTQELLVDVVDSDAVTDVKTLLLSLLWSQLSQELFNDADDEMLRWRWSRIVGFWLTRSITAWRIRGWSDAVVVVVVILMSYGVHVSDVRCRCREVGRTKAKTRLSK